MLLHLMVCKYPAAHEGGGIDDFVIYIKVLKIAAIPDNRTAVLSTAPKPFIPSLGLQDTRYKDMSVI